MAIGFSAISQLRPQALSPRPRPFRTRAAPRTGCRSPPLRYLGQEIAQMHREGNPARAPPRTQQKGPAGPLIVW